MDMREQEKALEELPLVPHEYSSDVIMEEFDYAIRRECDCREAMPGTRVFKFEGPGAVRRDRACAVCDRLDYDKFLYGTLYTCAYKEATREASNGETALVTIGKIIVCDLCFQKEFSERNPNAVYTRCKGIRTKSSTEPFPYGSMFYEIGACDERIIKRCKHFYIPRPVKLVKRARQEELNTAPPTKKPKSEVETQ